MTKIVKVQQVEVQNDVDVELSKILTVSGKIRYLNSLSWKRGQIAKKLGKRYQHVRNVLVTPIKKV